MNDPPPIVVPQTEGGGRDVVVLRDGSSLRGVVLDRDPRRDLVLFGPAGVRSIPWTDVERIEGSPPPPAEGPSGERGGAPSPPVPAPGPGDGLEAGVAVDFDLRAEGAALFKHYRTTSGQSYWSHGAGGGAAAGVYLRFHLQPTVDGDGTARGLDFELGGGDAIRAIGWDDGRGVAATLIENEISATVGASLSFGALDGHAHEPRWTGRTIGLAWVPTYVSFSGNDRVTSTGQLNPAGVRVTLDFGPLARRILSGPMLRLSLTWLPYVNTLPSMVAAGVGCVIN